MSMTLQLLLMIGPGLVKRFDFNVELPQDQNMRTS